MMMRDKKYDDATCNAYCCAKERERERERERETLYYRCNTAIITLHISKLIFPTHSPLKSYILSFKYYLGLSAGMISVITAASGDPFTYLVALKYTASRARAF